MSARRFERPARDRGAVLLMSAMLLLPMMTIAGFAVDVAAWYHRANQLQRAADAGALAGVVWMPNLTKATSEALGAIRRNGIDTTATNITVTIASDAGSDRRLVVTVKDTDVARYFAASVVSKQAIARSAISEYVMPVPLGSPDNRLGNDPPANYQPYLWASISGPFTDKNNGDPYSTKCTGGSSGTGCSKTNTEYRTNGYLYAIDVPTTAVGQTLTVQLYDAGNYARANYANVETADNGVVNTQFELFRADDTPYSYADNLVGDKSMSGKCLTAGPGKVYIADNASSATYKNQWVTLCSVTVAETGRWYLQVKSSNISGVTDAGSGWNQFSIKATLSGSTQPSVFGVNDFSLFNNLPGLSGTFTSTFYLARIDAAYAGKTLQISLFDPGDGQSGTYTVQVLKPGGVTTSCTYSARGAASTSTSNTCLITTRSSGTNTYNGKWLDLKIALPATYTCSTDCWWKVQYNFANVVSGSSPNDRTVWAATLTGDPVHLVK
ncbi:MAG: pilus assembly protein TadG-related protein [Acidimicrobiia bacterium]